MNAPQPTDIGATATADTATDADTRHWSHSVPMQELRTPAYVYSVDEVARRVRALKAALGTSVVLSFKACPSYEIVSRLPADCFDGVELASRGELHCFAGHKPHHFYVNTPALDASLARAAMGSGASLMIDAPHQLHLVHKQRGKNNLRPVGLRVSNRMIQRFTPEAPALRPDQFGMDMEALTEALTLAHELQIDVDGLHLFAGPHTFGRAARHVVTALKHVIAHVEAQLGHPLSWVSLGGGLEEHWASKGHDFDAYREMLAELPPHIEKVHEFGRAIFASAGVFVTKVVASKSIEGQRYAVCDGGMAQAFLLAQTENTFRKYRSPRVANREAERLVDGQKTILVGSSCSRDDVIGETNQAIEVGDLLVFESCGAYHRTYSMNNFLTLGEANSYVY